MLNYLDNIDNGHNSDHKIGKFSQRVFFLIKENHYFFVFSYNMTISTTMTMTTMVAAGAAAGAA